MNNTPEPIQDSPFGTIQPSPSHHRRIIAVFAVVLILALGLIWFFLNKLEGNLPGTGAATLTTTQSYLPILDGTWVSKFSAGLGLSLDYPAGESWMIGDYCTSTNPLVMIDPVRIPASSEIPCAATPYQPTTLVTLQRRLDAATASGETRRIGTGSYEATYQRYDDVGGYTYENYFFNNLQITFRYPVNSDQITRLVLNRILASVYLDGPAPTQTASAPTLTPSPTLQPTATPPQGGWN